MFYTKSATFSVTDFFDHKNIFPFYAFLEMHKSLFPFLILFTHSTSKYLPLVLPKFSGKYISETTAERWWNLPQNSGRRFLILGQLRPKVIPAIIDRTTANFPYFIFFYPFLLLIIFNFVDLFILILVIIDLIFPFKQGHRLYIIPPNLSWERTMAQTCSPA